MPMQGGGVLEELVAEVSVLVLLNAPNKRPY
jgi:hypothetical protein